MNNFSESFVSIEKRKALEELRQKDKEREDRLRKLERDLTNHQISNVEERRQSILPSQTFYAAEFKPVASEEWHGLSNAVMAAYNDNIHSVESTGQKFIEGIAKSIRTRIITGRTDVRELLSEEVSRRRSKTPRTDKKARFSFNDFFPEGLNFEGFTGFKFEGMKPKFLPRAETTVSLSEYESYVFVHSSKDDRKHIQHNIYQWVGEKSSIDKMASSAMLSTCLRDHLINSAYLRIESCEDSDSFYSLFNSKPILSEDHESNPSALTPPTETPVVFRVYRIYENGKFVSIHLAEPSFRHFKSEHIYILENGTTIFMWKGMESKFRHCVVARLLCEKIWKNDKLKREEGNETEDFWLLFSSISNEESGNSESSLIKRAEEPIHVYCVGEDRKLCYNGLFPTMDLLDSKHCYIIDCAVECFVWIGRRASLDETQRVNDQLADVVLAYSRPAWLGLYKIVQGYETEIFKVRFGIWGLLTINLPKAIRKFHVEVNDLFKLHPVSSSSSTEKIPEEMELNMARSNEMLKYLHIYSVKRTKIQRVEFDENFHFNSADCLVVICFYENVDQRGCVIYLWVGKSASTISRLYYLLEGRNMIERIVKEELGCEMTFFEVFEGNEPLPLIAHLRRKIVIVRGSVDAFPRLFHVKTHRRNYCTRAIQIPLLATSLVSRDIFLLQLASDRVLLWIGKGSSNGDLRDAHEMLKIRFAKANVEVVKERAETLSFWNPLGGKLSHPSGASNAYAKPPRFFVISCSLGYFKALEVVNWTVEDFNSNDVILFDPIMGSKVETANEGLHVDRITCERCCVQIISNGFFFL